MGVTVGVPGPAVGVLVGVCVPVGVGVGVCQISLNVGVGWGVPALVGVLVGVVVPVAAWVAVGVLVGVAVPQLDPASACTLSMSIFGLMDGQFIAEREILTLETEADGTSTVNLAGRLSRSKAFRSEAEKVLTVCQDPVSILTVKVAGQPEISTSLM